ncbi:hypothetical protein FOZ63_025493, partial [Perkinsus olseni]
NVGASATSYNGNLMGDIDSFGQETGPADQTSSSTAKQPGGDLLDDLDSILGMPPPVTSTAPPTVSAPSVPQQQQQPAKKADPFSGLGLDSLGFSMGTSGAKASVPSQPAPHTTAAGSFMDVFSPTPGPSQSRTITAYSNPDVRVDFAVTSRADGVDIDASFHSQKTLTDFILEAAVPKYLRLTLEPATSPTVQPDATVTQKLTVTQTTEPAKPIMMKLRIRYVSDGVPMEELTTVNNIPTA